MIFDDGTALFGLDMASDIKRDGNLGRQASIISEIVQLRERKGAWGMQATNGTFHFICTLLISISKIHFTPSWVSGFLLWMGGLIH